MISSFSLQLKRKVSSFQLIILSFAGVILLGSILLMLPISSSAGVVTSFSDALFTSTSAVCVTGLVVFDTAQYWSLFGQIVILILIQIGGMGIVTIAVSLVALTGRKIGLFQRDTMKDSISAPSVGGIVKLVGFVVKWIFIIELLGALILLPTFCRDFGWKGIWMAIFHSISAFCNAGFDLMGVKGAFSSLTSYSAEPLMNITIMLLIIVGGIGFLVWNDVHEHKWKLKKYSTQSKVVLISTLFLIVVPALYFFFFELSGLPIGERVLASLFQSITTRTAGFNTVNISSMNERGLSIIILLMLIGGSPGSTAGGMKTTTIFVLIAAAISVFRRKADTDILNRRVDNHAVKSAIGIVFIYFVSFWVGGLLISGIENIPLFDCLFECASAIGTVGLSLGITSSLGAVSKIILMLLMFLGRVGGLTLINAAMGGNKQQLSKHPIDKITIG